VYLYIHTPIRLHGVVLNYLSTGAALPFTGYTQNKHLVTDAQRQRGKVREELQEEQEELYLLGHTAV
jgi:hypothetical protein